MRNKHIYEEKSEEGSKMGYILPVNNEQYAQYANRVLAPRRQYQQLEGVQPIQVYTKSEEEIPFLQAAQMAPPSKKKKREKSSLKKEHIQNLYSNLTGKGQLVNEMV